MLSVKQQLCLLLSLSLTSSSHSFLLSLSPSLSLPLSLLPVPHSPGNSGMFRPEMLRPMGLPPGVRVIAWGLSLVSHIHSTPPALHTASYTLSKSTLIPPRSFYLYYYMINDTVYLDLTLPFTNSSNSCLSTLNSKRMEAISTNFASESTSFSTYLFLRRDRP